MAFILSMHDLSNEIVLRPRFVIELHQPFEAVSKMFEKTPEKPFSIMSLDEHIYLKFDAEHRSFWSPQLHLELISLKTGTTTVKGVFGPNPILWTFFMFLHFGVATMFVILGIWGYSKYSLGHDTTFIMGGMFFLVTLWFILYLSGSIGKTKNKDQMHQLRNYLDDIISELNAN
ncbi:MAG: GTP-binding protein [Bacteroidota bacterium]